MTPKTQIDAESASKELRYKAMERAGDILRDWVSGIQANKASSSLAVNSSVYISKSSGPTVSVLQGPRDDVRTARPAPAQINRPSFADDTSTVCADLKDLYGKDIFGNYISTPASCNYDSDSYFDLKNSKLFVKGLAYNSATIEPTKVALLSSSNSMTVDAANIWAVAGTKKAQFSVGTIGLWDGTNSNILTPTASTIVTGNTNSMTVDAANIWAREGAKSSQFSVGTIGLTNGTSSVTIANTGSVKIQTSGALTTIETPTGKPCAFKQVMDGTGSTRWVLCSDVITGGTALTCAQKPDATYKDVYLRNVYNDAGCSTSKSYLSLENSKLELKTSSSATLWTTVDALGVYVKNGADSTSISASELKTQNGTANTAMDALGLSIENGTNSTYVSAIKYLSTDSTGSSTLMPGSLDLKGVNAGQYISLGSTDASQEITINDSTRHIFLRTGDITGAATVQFRKIFDATGEERWVLCSDKVTGTTKGGATYTTQLKAAVKAEIKTIVSALNITATCNSDGTVTVTLNGKPVAETPTWPTSFIP